MRRAIQAIPILLSLQNEGNSIERLYKRGMLTDDMHFKVKELKAFVDQEFQDVQFEADELVDGWGQQIWPQAMQFHQVDAVFLVLSDPILAINHHSSYLLQHRFSLSFIYEEVSASPVNILPILF
jgi:hypothetical protein